MPSTILERLRNAHHKPAKLFAAGYSVCQVAVETRRTEKNITDLQSDPAFAGLVQFYKGKGDED